MRACPFTVIWRDPLLGRTLIKLLSEELAALLDELLIGATLEELLDELLKELLDEAGWLELIALLEDSAALLDAAGGGSWATQACKANSMPAAKTRE